MERNCANSEIQTAGSSARQMPWRSSADTGKDRNGGGPVDDKRLNHIPDFKKWIRHLEMPAYLSDKL